MNIDKVCNLRTKGGMYYSAWQGSMPTFSTVRSLEEAITNRWKVYLKESGGVSEEELMDLERDLSNLASFMAPFTLTQLRSKVAEMRDHKIKDKFASRGVFKLKPKDKPSEVTNSTYMAYAPKIEEISTVPMIKDDDQSVILKNLTCQTISITHASISVVLENLNGCTVSVGPTKTSVVLQDCRDCTIQVAGQQIRARNLFNCTVGLWSPTGIIVESSRDCKYLPYELKYDGLDEDLCSCGFREGENRWNEVYDFDSPLSLS